MNINESCSGILELPIISADLDAQIWARSYILTQKL